jgi:hypothetical protein
MPNYTPGQPQQAQPFRVSRPIIADNFDSIAEAIANDHVEVTNADATKRILHKKVTLNEVQGSDPNLTYPQSEIYSKSDGGTSQILYWDRVSTTHVDLITPISPLAMVKFSGAGTITKQINISGAIGVSGSVYTVNFTNAMPDANYIPIVSARRGTNQPLISVEITNTTQVVIRITDSAGSTMVPSDVYMVVWGF